MEKKTLLEELKFLDAQYREAWEKMYELLEENKDIIEEGVKREFKEEYNKD